MMEKIALYILKKYGYNLSESELRGVIEWYENNKEVITTEKELDTELQKYLIKTYPNKELILLEEDTSNMNYLLSLLKDRNSK